MKTICIVGPVPPPMNGNSKAIDTILRSELINKKFCVLNIDTSNNLTGKSGKFSLKKVLVLVRTIRRIINFSKKYKIDLFYLTNAQARVGIIRDYIILNVIKKNNPHSKIVAHLHGGGFRKYYDGESLFFKNLIQNMYSDIDVVIVLSPSLMTMYEGIVEAQKIKVVYNCVDNEYVFPHEMISTKNDRFVSKEYLSVCYLSNMIESKGYLKVLDVAKKCAETGLKVYFEFAGKFTSENDKMLFLEKIYSNSLENIVKYNGIVSGMEKRNMLLRGDIFVLPTRYKQEGQPISILEAMAAGQIIITTNQGGITDVIKDNINGYIINDPIVNSKDIYDLIYSIYHNRDRYKCIGITNYYEVMDKYRENVYLSSLEKIFTDTIHGDIYET